MSRWQYTWARWAAGIPLLAGREFASTDRRGTALVVIVNEALADGLFPGEDPLGRRIAWTGDILRFTPFTGDWRTIVGVVGNTRDAGLDAPSRPAAFMPFDQELALGGSLAIRAERDVEALLPAVTRIVRRIAPAAPIEDVRTIAQVREQSVSPRRLVRRAAPAGPAVRRRAARPGHVRGRGRDHGCHRAGRLLGARPARGAGGSGDHHAEGVSVMVRAGLTLAVGQRPGAEGLAVSESRALRTRATSFATSGSGSLRSVRYRV